MSLRILGCPTRTSHRSILVLAAALSLLAVPVPASASGGGQADHDVAPAPASQRDNLARGFILKQLRQMTLEEKVGQLFVTYAYGETVDTTNPADVSSNRGLYGLDNAAALIDKYHLGGIVYFAWSNNVNNPPQIAKLSNGIQRAALAQRRPIPMLISTDQEQGTVARVGPPATQFPGNMALGAARDPGNAFSAARITGQELHALGINQDFAPDSDVNTNPLNPVIGVRSFGEDPALVSRLVAAEVNGYQPRDGVAAALKHFPGHGDTVTDSHTGVPWIFHSKQQWETVDAPPFRAGIAAGVDMIMTAHVVMPELQSDCDVATQQGCDPATLDPEILTGLLRDELGYDGVVITDSLGMQGVRDKYGDDRIPVLALKAGVDMLLMPANLDLAYNSVLNAVRSGEISQRRIDESVYRVLRLKFSRGLFQHPYVDAGRIDRVVGTAAHYAQAQRVTDQTTTLVKNDAGLLPLAAGGGGKTLVTGWGVATTQTLADDIARRGSTTEVYQTGTNPSQATIDQAVARAKADDLVVVTTTNAWQAGQAGQRRLVDALVATGKPVIAIAVSTPYDIAYFTAAPTYLATYSYTPGALEAVTKVIFGEVSPAGKLPVTIPVAGDAQTPLYPYGHGLTY